MQILSRRAPRRTLGPFICQSCKRSLRSFSISIAAQSRAPRAPPPPPPFGYAQLTSRRLISIAGPDAPKFLHGIITQSVVDEPVAGSRRQNTQSRITAANSTIGALGFYTAFLNATGRVLHDVFIYRDTLGLAGAGEAADGEAFVIEVDAAQVETLAKHIKRYKLRSKLKFRILDEAECVAWQVWDDETPTTSATSTSTPPSSLSSTPTPPTLQQLLQQPKDYLVLPDTRAPGMGFRVLSTGQRGLDALELPQSDDTAYRVRRYLRGVAEGQTEIPREHALPLEANMDVCGGIDFRKGCYVGQELTIRTRHRGVVRKRILPCLLYPSTTASPPQQLEYSPYIDSEGEEGLVAEDVPPNLSIGRATAKGRSAGTWLTGVGNIGLAVCRLQIMTDVELPGETAAAAPFNPETDEFIVKWGANEEGEGGQSLKAKAFVPEWLRERLKEDSESASAH